MISQLPRIISGRLFRNSSNEEVFNTSKEDYEEALKGSGHSNIITKSCMLWLHKKFEILTYPKQDELLNKMAELFSKCRQINKCLLSSYRAND